MSQDSKTLYVGIDLHKDLLSIAVLEQDAREPEAVVTLPNQAATIRRCFRRLQQRGFVVATYEAGCFGFVLYRLLSALGVHCVVAAPSHLPKIPGDRRKTDRIDSRRLALFLRAGQIVSVTPPTPESEALRGLTRLRQTLREDKTRIRQRITKFLLLRGHVYRDGSAWSAGHLRWLRDLPLALAEDRLTLDCLLEEFEHRRSVVALLDQRIERRAEAPDIEEAVRCLRAFRGIDTLTAVSVIAELGDPRRFRSARQVAAWCGMVPSEHSSGDKIRRGPITRAGNGRLRRLLVEAAQQYARPFKLRGAAAARRPRAPQRAQSLAATAEQRLRRRYRALALRKHTNLAKLAVARELIGFLWLALLPASTSSRPTE